MKTWTQLILLLCWGLHYSLGAQPSYTIKYLPLPEDIAQLQINDIQQDQLGLLWLATNDGLHFFDGRQVNSFRHQPFNQKALRSNSITDLFLNHNSRLLLGTEVGLHRYLKSSNSFEYYDFGQPIHVLSISEDLHDHLWVLCKDGLYWMYHEPGTDFHWGKADLPQELDFNEMEFTEMFISPKDEMWLASKSGVFILDIQKRCSPKLISSPDSQRNTESLGTVQTIVRDGKGRTWIGSKNRTITITKEDQVIEALGEKNHDFQKMPSKEIVLSSSGQLYIASNNIVYDLKSDEEVEAIRPLKLNYGFDWPEENIDKLKEDRLNPRNLIVLFEDNRLGYLQLAEVNTTAIRTWNKDNGALIPIGQGGLLAPFDESRYQFISPKISSASQQPLLPKGTIPHRLIDVGMTSTFQSYLWKDSLWIVSSIGSENATSIYQDDAQWTCLSTQNDRLWIGSENEGLKLVDPKNGGEAVMHFQYDQFNPSGLLSNKITDVLVDSKRSLWVGTDLGISVSTDSSFNFVHYGTLNGLPSNGIRSIHEDDLGRLWILTDSGLALFDQEEKRFNQVNGLPDIIDDNVRLTQIGSTMLLQADTALIRIETENFQLKRDLVPVRLDKVVDASGHYHHLLYRNPDHVIELQYAHNSLNVEFLTIQFGNHQNYTFSYSLEGPDPKSGTLMDVQRFNINSLSDGHYTLTIHALDDRGEICGQDQIKLAVFKPFWKSGTFFTLILLGIMLLGMVYVWIMRDQRQKRLAAIHDIRKKTAADFHDELGSRLTVISLYGNMIKQKKEEVSEESAAYLEKVLNSANELYFAMKDVIWSLKPEAESLNGLTQHIGDLGQRLFENSDTEFVLMSNLESTKDIPLSKDQSKQLSLIVREGMHNALRHAKAQTFKLEIKHHLNFLNIDMIDDGVGLSKKGSGEGFENMKIRAEKLNGKLTILDRKKGLHLHLSVPNVPIN